MSYCGIGLTTARGSGTNGYVQRNLSFVSKPKSSQTQNAVPKPPPQPKKPNKELLEHEQKRRIELRVAEAEMQLKEKGVSAEEIALQLVEVRKLLEKKSQKGELRPTKSFESHQYSAAKLQQNQKFASALKLMDSQEGKAFERMKKTGADSTSTASKPEEKKVEQLKPRKKFLDRVLDEAEDDKMKKKDKKHSKSSKKKKSHTRRSRSRSTSLPRREAHRTRHSASRSRSPSPAPSSKESSSSSSSSASSSSKPAEFEIEKSRRERSRSPEQPRRSRSRSPSVD